MGYRNAQIIYGTYQRLRGDRFRLLVYMALHTHDEERPLIYSGTYEDLLVGIGSPLPEGIAPEERGEFAEYAREYRRLRLKQLRKLLVGLEDEGAIKRLTARAAPQQPVQFQVNLIPASVVHNSVHNPGETLGTDCG